MPSMTSMNLPTRFQRVTGALAGSLGRLPPSLLRPLVISALVIAALGTSYYFYTRYQATQAELAELRSNPQAATAQELKQLVETVGKLVELPTGEDPTVATITDKAKLADQPFFSRAENGDKVLVFANAKKAILYRPSSNKILDIAPVNTGASPPPP